VTGATTATVWRAGTPATPARRPAAPAWHRELRRFAKVHGTGAWGFFEDADAGCWWATDLYLVRRVPVGTPLASALAAAAAEFPQDRRSGHGLWLWLTKTTAPRPHDERHHSVTLATVAGLVERADAGCVDAVSEVVAGDADEAGEFRRVLAVAGDRRVPFLDATLARALLDGELLLLAPGLGPAAVRDADGGLVGLVMPMAAS
jgi:hypothetical protein